MAEGPSRPASERTDFPYVTLRLDELGRLVHSLEAVRPFVVTADWRPILLADSAALGRRRARRGDVQLDLFAAEADAA